MTTGADALCTVETESGRTKHENVHDTLDTAENDSGRVKHEKWVPTPSVPPKTSPGEQNMKMVADALGTTEN
jgi:hypothetical protein